jgi:hypothetical protein
VIGLKKIKKEKIMNKRQIIASLNKIANELDTAKLYTEANTVTKVMSKIAMDENDEYNMEDYFPYGDPDGDDDEYETKREPSMREELDSDMMQVSDMLDPMGTSNRADDILSHHAKDYDKPRVSDLENVFDELDTMIEDSMLSPRDQKRYDEIKRRIMRSYTPIN